MGTPALDGDVGGWPRPGEWRRLATRLPVSPSKHISACRSNRRPPQWASAPNPHRDTPVQEAEGKRDPGREVRGTDQASFLSEGREGEGCEAGDVLASQVLPRAPATFSGISRATLSPWKCELAEAKGLCHASLHSPLHTAQFPGRKGVDLDLEIREEMGASGPRAEKGHWSWAVEEIKTGRGEKKEKKGKEEMEET